MVLYCDITPFFSQKKHLVKYANDAYERRDFEEAANTFSELIKVSERKNVEVSVDYTRLR